MYFRHLSACLRTIHVAALVAPLPIHPDDLDDWENEIRYVHDNVVLQGLSAAGGKPRRESLLLLSLHARQAVRLIRDQLRLLLEVVAHLRRALPNL